MKFVRAALILAAFSTGASAACDGLDFAYLASDGSVLAVRATPSPEMAEAPPYFYEMVYRRSSGDETLCRVLDLPGGDAQCEDGTVSDYVSDTHPMIGVRMLYFDQKLWVYCSAE